MIVELKALYKYKEMLKNTVKKDLRSRYKGSVLGFLWTFLNPLLMLAVYTVVFSSIMRMEIPGHSYTMYLFIGIVPWSFISNTISQSTTLVVANGSLVKKVYFPRVILPLSCTATNFINMLLSFIVVIICLVMTGNGINIYYLYLPLIIVLNFIFVFSLAMFLSCITVYFRDLEHIASIVLMAWMYLTPIIYVKDFIPDSLYGFFKLNPLFFIINSYHDIFMFKKAPDFMGLAYVGVLCAGLLVSGYIVFYRLQKRFAEEL